MTEVAGTIDEKDGTLVVKDTEGKEVRYTKESDLLTVKESRDNLQKKLDAAEKDKNTANTEADTRVADARQQVIKAEADVERLSEEIKKHTGTAEQLKELQTKLEAAQTAEKSTATALLDLRRTFIINTYKVPPETVNEKDLAGLQVFEEALKAVIGASGGNYAFGGGGGGANALEGKSPMELAQIAYSNSK